MVTWLGSLPGHVQYGDMLLGPGTSWSMVADGGLEGWEETPPMDSGTVLRSQQHGAYPGRLLAQARTVTLNLIGRSDPGQMDQAAAALAAGTPPDAEEEVPLIVQLDATPMLAFGRCTRRALPPVRAARRTGLARGAALQFVCTDPRRYGLTELAPVTGLPQPGQGLDWADGSSPAGLDWHDTDPTTGLDWGTDGSSGDLTAVNAGDAPASPVIEFRGPVERPSCTLVETGQVLEYDLPLAASDVLTVDTWAETVTLASGASRLYTVTLRSSPEGAFVLPARTSSTLAFRAAPGSTDPAATMTVRYRPAYW